VKLLKNDFYWFIGNLFQIATRRGERFFRRAHIKTPH
jgi:hypothetical protein